MKSPLNFRSESTMGFLVGLVLMAAVGLRFFVKDEQMQTYIGAGLIVGLFVLLGFKMVEARLRALPKPHLVNTIRIWPSGNPIQRDFFFEVTDPARKILDITPLMPLSKKGTPMPYKVRGRYYWIYRSRDAFVVDIPKYRKTYEHVWILTMPWEKWRIGHRRENGAYYLAEVMDHGNSDCGTTYLAPFAAKILEKYIPLFFGVEGTGVYNKVTQSWATTLEEMAKMARLGFDKIARDHSEFIWPNTVLDEIAPKAGIEDEDLKKKVLEVMAKSQ